MKLSDVVFFELLKEMTRLTTGPHNAPGGPFEGAQMNFATSVLLAQPDREQKAAVDTLRFHSGRMTFPHGDWSMNVAADLEEDKARLEFRHRMPRLLSR